MIELYVKFIHFDDGMSSYFGFTWEDVDRQILDEYISEHWDEYFPDEQCPTDPIFAQKMFFDGDVNDEYVTEDVWLFSPRYLYEALGDISLADKLRKIGMDEWPIGMPAGLNEEEADHFMTGAYAILKMMRKVIDEHGRETAVHSDNRPAQR